jgi:2-desacetyl-2-hydroxyethyl bacteriochlorophyllide A dehydrogenase
MKRRSIIFTGKEAVELIQEDVPEINDDQLLIETEKTLISTGTESTVYRRNFAPGTHWDNWVKYPFYTGYLNVGKVVKVGKNVKDWKKGDRAVSRSGHSSFIIADAVESRNAAKADEGDCTPVNRAVKVPDDVIDDEAVWMGLGKIVQVGVRAAEHKLGDDVVVIGLGLLGQLVVQYVRNLGASEIIAIDTSAKRLEMAAAHGATQTLKMNSAEAEPIVKKLTGGRKADVVYDVTGHPAVFATALPLARNFGTVVLLGDPGSPHLQTLTPDLITRGLKLVGAHDCHPPAMPNQFVRWSSQEMYELFLKYLSRKQMKVSDLITNRFKPEDCKEAYTYLQTDRENAMGVIFDWK